MSNRRKAKRPRGPGEGLRLVAGQGAGQSLQRGELHAVGAQAIVGGKRVTRRELPAAPGTAAGGIHVVTVSLHGAEPPLTFAWTDFGPHSHQTPYGEFGDSAVTLAQAAGKGMTVRVTATAEYGSSTPSGLSSRRTSGRTSTSTHRS